MSFDFDAAVTAPFRMQPGLRRLAPGALQLTPTRGGTRHLREKLAVLSAYAPWALLARPGFDAGAALAGLATHAAAEHPSAWAWDGRQAAALALGVAVAGGQVVELAQGCFGLGDEVGRCLRQLSPEWRLAGLLSLAFEEDFALVDTADGSIPWLAVALPSHWAPEDKVGRHFTAVHAPVADNTLLLKATEGLMHAVSGPQRWERFVWNVSSQPRLHGHPRHTDPARWTVFDANLAWWRTERQTFIPLPGLRQAVFTIHVQVERLADAVHGSARAARLHAAVASMSPAVLAYRNLAGVREPLLHWLAGRA